MISGFSQLLMDENMGLMKDLYLKEIYDKFLNAGVLRLYSLNVESGPSQTFRKAYSIEMNVFHINILLWKQISKKKKKIHRRCF